MVGIANKLKQYKYAYILTFWIGMRYIWKQMKNGKNSANEIYKVRWVKMYNFFIFQRFYSKASSFTSKSKKKAKVCRSLQYSQVEMELWTYILALSWEKTMHDIVQIFFRFLSLSSLKHKFTIPLKKHTDFELLHLQNP